MEDEGERVGPPESEEPTSPRDACKENQVPSQNERVGPPEEEDTIPPPGELAAGLGVVVVVAVSAGSSRMSR